MNTESMPQETEPVCAKGGLASWEAPHLPLMQRVRKHWRQMLVHVWGPVGSVAFHAIAIGTLLTLMPNQPGEYQQSGPIEIATIPTDEPLEPPPVVPPTTKPVPPSTSTGKRGCKQSYFTGRAGAACLRRVQLQTGSITA